MKSYEIHQNFSETPAHDFNGGCLNTPTLPISAPDPSCRSEKVVAVVAFIGRMPYPKP